MMLKVVSLLLCIASWPNAMPVQQALEGSTPEDIPPTFEVGTIGPVPTGLNLEYGPEFGVTYSEIKYHRKNFDDTMYMGIAGDTKHHREIYAIECAYKTNFWGGALTSLQTAYAFGNEYVSSKLRGYRFAWHTKRKVLRLDAKQRLTAVAIRECNGIFMGIKFSAHDQSDMACGNFIGHDDGCEYPVLNPPKGRHVVGLYGDSNGVFNTKHRGVRGIGLITMAN